MGTNTLTDGFFHFSDLQWTNYARRFYRLRWLVPPKPDYTYTIKDVAIPITEYIVPGSAVERGQNRMALR